MNQKRWNKKAQVAGKRASSQARKRGASGKEVRRAYLNAYGRVRDQSPIGKVKKKRNNQRYRSSPKGRIYRSSLKAKTTVQECKSRRSLKTAWGMKNNSLDNGWPDAARIEQKVGSDSVQIDQWRRAAWVSSKGVVLYLLFVKTHEEAVFGKPKIISFRNYAKELGMLKEWNRLVHNFTQKKART